MKLTCSAVPDNGARRGPDNWVGTITLTLSFSRAGLPMVGRLAKQEVSVVAYGATKHPQLLIAGDEIPDPTNAIETGNQSEGKPGYGSSRQWKRGVSVERGLCDSQSLAVQKFIRDRVNALTGFVWVWLMDQARAITFPSVDRLRMTVRVWRRRLIRTVVLHKFGGLKPPTLGIYRPIRTLA